MSSNPNQTAPDPTTIPTQYRPYYKELRETANRVGYILANTVATNNQKLDYLLKANIYWSNVMNTLENFVRGEVSGGFNANGGSISDPLPSATANVTAVDDTINQPVEEDQPVEKKRNKNK